MLIETTWRERLTNAIAFWERGRIAYNIVLVAIVAIVFWFGWPDSRNAVSIDKGLGLFLLAVLANVAYCAAYPVDVMIQSSGFRETWLRYRWLLLILGICFAGVVTQFFVRGMFDVDVGP
jgi:hypothetical protein